MRGMSLIHLLVEFQPGCFSLAEMEPSLTHLFLDAMDASHALWLRGLSPLTKHRHTHIVDQASVN